MTKLKTQKNLTLKKRKMRKTILLRSFLPWWTSEDSLEPSTFDVANDGSVVVAAVVVAAANVTSVVHDASSVLAQAMTGRGLVDVQVSDA